MTIMYSMSEKIYVFSYSHYNEHFEEWIQDDVFLVVETTILVWMEKQNG